MKLLRIALLVAASLLIAANAKAAGTVRVVDAWVKATVPGQKVAGIYMELNSPIDARLTGVSCHLARSAEIHSMKMEGGTMKMRPLKSLDLPAGKTVKLEPGGVHVMLFDIERPLRFGDRLPITLTIATGQRTREVLVEAIVRKSGAEADGHERH
jgi:copper(I)-binding protein